jgi:DNA-dependent RNA polymerase auxiliary subunit epsilon
MDVSEKILNNKYIVNYNYNFITNVNNKLSEILNIPDFEFEEEEIWKPPTTYGLSNCEYIIPTYYDRPKNGVLDIEYYDIIIDDIRNHLKLNKYQLEFIKDLSHADKNEIIENYHKCSEQLIDVFLQLP